MPYWEWRSLSAEDVVASRARLATVVVLQRVLGPKGRLARAMGPSVKAPNVYKDGLRDDAYRSTALPKGGTVG